MFWGGLDSDDRSGGDEPTLDSAGGTGLEFQQEWREQRIVVDGNGISHRPWNQREFGLARNADEPRDLAQ